MRSKLLDRFTYQSSLAEESIKKGLCKTMIKIINNQKTIKSFSLRLVDLNGCVVKTITETQHPVSTTIEIPFTEDDYNIMDDRLSVKLSVTYKDSIIKYIESTNFDAMATDMEVTVFDSTKKPSINMVSKTKPTTKNTDTDKAYVYVKSIFDEYTSKNKDIITAKDNADLSKDYATQSLESSREAERYKNQAFLATPEGYAEVVQKVNGLDIAVRTGKTFLVEDSANGNCLIKTIYGMSEQDGTPAPTAPMPIKDMQVKLRNKGKNLVYFPHTGHPISQYPFTYTINGVIFIFQQDGTIIANGTATGADAVANINSFYAYDTSNDLISGKTYYISDGREGVGAHPNGYVQFTLTNAEGERDWVASTRDMGKVAYTSDNDQYDKWGVRVIVNKGQTANHVVIKPMVSFNDDTSYVMGTPKEDKETDIILRALEVEADDEYNLVKDGKYYIADTLDDTDDGYVITRRVGHVVLDGTENWTKSDTNEEGAYRRILNDSRFPSYAQLGTTLPTPNKKGYIVSSAYPECMTNGLRHPYYCSVAIALHDTGHWCQIYDERYNGASDIAEWKAHLAEEPLTVNYRLFKWEKEIVSSTDAQILYNLISEESTTLELVSDVDGVMDVIIPSTTAAGAALTGYTNARLNTVKLNEIQTALMELEGVQN